MESQAWDLITRNGSDATVSGFAFSNSSEDEAGHSRAHQPRTAVLLFL